MNYKAISLICIGLLSPSLVLATDSCQSIFASLKVLEFDPENPNYYSRLGLNPAAEPAQIQRAYRKAAFAYHPDRSTLENSEEAFKSIKEAYETLIDVEKKAAYDAGKSQGSPYKGYANKEVIEMWGQKSWNQIVKENQEKSDLKLSSEDLGILVRWLKEGEGAVSFSKFKPEQSGPLAVTIVRVLGDRLQVDELIRIVSDPAKPGTMASQAIIRDRAIFQLLKIYRADRSQIQIPRLFADMVIRPNGGRAVDTIVRGLEFINTAEANQVLAKIMINQVGWIDGQGRTFSNWTAVVKDRAAKILKNRK